MNKTSIPIFIGMIVVAVIFFGIFFLNKEKNKKENYKEILMPTNTSTSTSDAQSMVRTFFQHLSDGNISEAVLMMSPEVIANDSTKQAWGVQLNSFSFLQLLSVDPVMKEEWTNTTEEYKVVINAKMKQESATALIPYYGWNDGSNTRFIILEKKGNIWYIQAIGTGP